MFYSTDIPDHPVIRNMIETGSPDRCENAAFRCPRCGNAAENFYAEKSGAVVGCDICLTPHPYYEFETEENEND